MERPNAWKNYKKKDLAELEKLNKAYITFLSKNKTERECTVYAVEEAKKAGYVDINELIKKKKKLHPGDKVYAVNMKKAVVLFNIGKKSIEKGMAILGAHIDRKVVLPVPGAP